MHAITKTNLHENSIRAVSLCTQVYSWAIVCRGIGVVIAVSARVHVSGGIFLWTSARNESIMASRCAVICISA